MGQTLSLLRGTFTFNAGSTFGDPEEDNPTLTASQNALAMGISISPESRFYGAVIIDQSATMNLNTAFLQIQRLELRDGTITGQNNPFIYNRMIWFAGTMSGTGKTTDEAGAFLNLSCRRWHTQPGRPLLRQLR